MRSFHSLQSTVIQNRGVFLLTGMGFGALAEGKRLERQLYGFAPERGNAILLCAVTEAYRRQE